MPKLGVAQIVAADIDDVVDELVGVDELAFEEQRSAADAREVEKVVDRADLEHDVAPDHLEDRQQGLGRIGVAEHGGDGGEDGRERGAKLVREMWPGSGPWRCWRPRPRRGRPVHGACSTRSSAARF